MSNPGAEKIHMAAATINAAGYVVAESLEIQALKHFEETGILESSVNFFTEKNLTLALTPFGSMIFLSAFASWGLEHYKFNNVDDSNYESNNDFEVIKWIIPPVLFCLYAIYEYYGGGVTNQLIDRIDMDMWSAFAGVVVSEGINLASLLYSLSHPPQPIELQENEYWEEWTKFE